MNGYERSYEHRFSLVFTMKTTIYEQALNSL